MARDTIVTIIGNLTADPEVRSMSNGGRVANVAIISTPRQSNRTSGQWEDGDVLFMHCSAWDTRHQSLASSMQASLTKGMRVIAHGRLVQRYYQDRDGNNRTVVDLRLDEINPAQVTRNNSSGGNQGGGAGFAGAVRAGTDRRTDGCAGTGPVGGAAMTNPSFDPFAGVETPPDLQVIEMAEDRFGDVFEQAEEMEIAQWKGEEL